jgi:hypothetical protein
LVAGVLVILFLFACAYIGSTNESQQIPITSGSSVSVSPPTAPSSAAGTNNNSGRQVPTPNIDVACGLHLRWSAVSRQEPYQFTLYDIVGVYGTWESMGVEDFTDAVTFERVVLDTLTRAARSSEQPSQDQKGCSCLEDDATANDENMRGGGHSCRPTPEFTMHDSKFTIQISAADFLLDKKRKAWYDRSFAPLTKAGTTFHQVADLESASSTSTIPWALRRENPDLERNTDRQKRIDVADMKAACANVWDRLNEALLLNVGGV